MYNRILLLLLVLAVTLPFMGCKKDDNHPTQYITGRVILTNTGKPINDCDVRLEVYSEKGCGFFSNPKSYCLIGKEITTDSTGEFKFSYDRDNLNGDYRINLRSINASGSVKITTIVDGENTNTNSRWVDLARSEIKTDITYKITIN